MPTRVAYLVNQYPKVSHSFIRREILALERLGIAVQRIAIRGWNDPITDPEDVAERAITRYALQGGAVDLALATARVVLSSPLRFARALAMAVRLSRKAERPLPFHLIYLAEACRILHWLRAEGAQHIHAHFGTNSAEVALLSHALGGPPYSFTVHGPEEFDKPQFISLAEKVRQSSFVVAISSYGRSQLYRWVEHRYWNKIRIVRCGLETSFHDIAPAPVADVPRLVCVGRLCEQKGQLLLIQALALLKQRGIGCELVLAGDGEMRAEIEQLIRDCQLEDRVRITGWISSAQVRDEILAARALVLPSFAEGLPVVIMESMALRRPVLTTCIAGIPELVRNIDNGWLFAAGSIEELADAMQSCLATPLAELRRMGEAAHDRVLQFHSVDAEAARLAQHFRDAIAGGEPAIGQRAS
jgi:glycosyltransferase involved in cell wall biosynthesis